MKIENKKYPKTAFSSGFTLLEVLFAVAVLSIGIIGSVNLIGYDISIISTSINRVIASNLAQDGVELVRNIRDTNWLAGNNWDSGIEGVNSSNDSIQFFCNSTASGDTKHISSPHADIETCGSNCQTYIYTKNSDGTQCYSDNFNNQVGYSRAVTNFYRLINLSKQTDISGNDFIQVTARIKWIDQRGTHYLPDVVENLYNWRN